MRSITIQAINVSLVASLSEWIGMSANEGVVKTKGSTTLATARPIVTQPALVLAFVAMEGASSAPTLADTPFQHLAGVSSNAVGLGGAYLAIDGEVVPAVTWTVAAPWAAVAAAFPKK
ncbi:MAG: hypothetical protein KIT84_13780 [Labilithrix sp.]|nr:hypothetical protein [Labilithrix sp.]MCW5812089.1 hypothetical protein [Labilithrix sp.]